MAKRGPRTKYDPAFHPKIIKYMARCGMKDTEIAEDLGIAESTLNNWKKTYPDLLESIKENKSFIDSLVEDSLLKKALGYSYNETHEEEIFIKDPNDPSRKLGGTKRKIIKKHVPASDIALIFWLKNRQPKRWRDVNKLWEPEEEDNLDIEQEEEERIKKEYGYVLGEKILITDGKD